jgi:hypothetical protein
MEISTPFNFQHIQHVKADPHTSTGFAVRPPLPPALSSLSSIHRVFLNQ